jgi:hypothetical protein
MVPLKVASNGAANEESIMSHLSRRIARIAAATCVVASISMGAGTGTVNAASSGKSYKVTATFKGAKNLTVLVLARSGRLLASKSITSSSQSVTLTTSKTGSLGGATLQLVGSSGSTSKGDYFGPVVLGWKGTSASKATRVYTTVKKVTTRQGYAVTSKSLATADSASASQVAATSGRPRGVGTYGKTAGAAIASVGVRSAGVVDELLGGDTDDDGIPNAFDVNDDGDAIIDAADSTTPSPKVSADVGGVLCPSVNFRIFTNLKSTSTSFAGTINAYGTGAFKADKTNIASTVTRSMTMVFSPITNVCGSNVVKTELKGVGVPYAPSSYETLSNTCDTGDYQWLIGQGKMCGTGGSSYSFGSPYTFTASDLPSGQDTFSVRVTTATGATFEFTSTPGFVFVTHPMLVAYGTSADPGSAINIDYSNTTVGPEGTRLASEPVISVAQDQTLYLKIYRPQRLAIDGEPGDFYDLGGYRYTPDIPNGSPAPGKCDALTVIDSTMTTDTVINETTPPTLRLAWAIGQKCYTESTRSPKPTFSVGAQDFDIQVEPTGPGGNSAQKVRITYTVPS